MTVHWLPRRTLALTSQFSVRRLGSHVGDRFELFYAHEVNWLNCRYGCTILRHLHKYCSQHYYRDRHHQD